MQRWEKKKLVSPDVLAFLRETVWSWAGFSASLILSSSIRHYLFKIGEEVKQREGADYKKVDQGKLGGGGMGK